MLHAVHGSSDEEKQFEEDFIQSHVENLYGINLDVNHQPDAPHWLSHFTTDKHDFITQCNEACGVWDTTDDVIVLQNETGMIDGEYHKVHSERIAEEVEIQDDDGLWYTGFPIIVGLYVRIPEHIDDINSFIDDVEPNTARYIN
jgi:hypothetical protein